MIGIDEILTWLESRKESLDGTMRDIATQQIELDNRRSRIEGRLAEIEYMIVCIESKVE